MAIQVEVDCSVELSMEIWSHPSTGGGPLHEESLREDLADLVEETYARGVLSGELPEAPDALRCHVQPVFATAPFVQEIQVELAAAEGGDVRRFRRRYTSGPWIRRARLVALELRSEGELGTDESAVALVVAAGRNGASSTPPLGVTPLSIPRASLADLGVRALGAGAVAPDRPVLVSSQVVRDGVQLCVEAGASEAGAAVLGRLARLSEPLPGARSRVVTVLSALLPDSRHAGAPGSVTFDPEALVEAERVADLRGRGESVLAVLHSHGWGTDCGQCHRRDSCPLPVCSEVSELDYKLMESLFPGKTAVMPIVGRSRGAQASGPVVAVHAWENGELRLVEWRQYED